jgi:hypothetical protein
MPNLPRLIITAHVMIDSGRYGNKKREKASLTSSKISQSKNGVASATDINFVLVFDSWH